MENILSPVFRELCSIKGMLRAKYPPPISNVEHLILRLARMQMLSHRPSPTQGPKQTLKDKHWWGTKTQTNFWKISIEAVKSWAWKMCDTQASLPLFQFNFQILCYSFHITSTRNVYAEIFASCAIRRPRTWSSQRSCLGSKGVTRSIVETVE